MLAGRHGAVVYLKLSLLNHQSHIAAVAVMFEGINKELLSYLVKAIKLKLNYFYCILYLHPREIVKETVIIKHSDVYVNTAGFP